MGLATAAVCLALLTHGLTLAQAQCADELKVTGGGSNAVGKFVADSVNNATQDANYKDVELPFYTVGSAQGVSGWQNATFDYTIIDNPLSSKDFQAAGRPLLQIPLAFGAVTAFYNIPGMGSSVLRLTAPVAAGIWQGTIKTWDDPAILAINPNLTKIGMPPATPITVIVRNDSAAATGAWTRWLSVAGNGTWLLGVNDTISNYPATFKSVSGGTNLGYAIGNASYSIGVLDAFAGRRLRLNDSALASASNVSNFLRFSRPGSDYNLTDLGGAPPIVLPPPNGDWGNFSLVNLPGKKTFPIITQATIVTGSDVSQLGTRGRVQKQTFLYLLGPTVQNFAYAYQEVPLPEQFLQYSVAAANSIKTGPGLNFYQSVQLPAGAVDGSLARF